MPASIIIDQVTLPAGTAGKARSDGVVSQLVTCTNSTAESSYLWTLVDVPIRSALVRGTTGVAAAFTFTPDVKGTYTVSLQVNGSGAPADNDSSYLAIRSFSAKALGWRYQGAGETSEDNEDYVGLGFPANTNIRGWATNKDLIFEEIETGIWETQNAITTYGGLISRIVMTDPTTGKVSSTLISGTAPTGPAGGDLTGTYPNPSVVALRGRAISATWAPADGQTLWWNTGANEFQLSGDVLTQSTGLTAAIQDGTAAAPALKFKTSPTTGIYKIAADVLGISSAGALLARFDPAASYMHSHWMPGAASTYSLGGPFEEWSNLYVGGIHALGAMDLSDGTAANPSLTFTADLNTGLFRAGADQLGIAAGGVEVVRFQAPGGLLPQAVFAQGAAGNPSVSFSGRPTQGMFSVSNFALGFATDQTTSYVSFLRVTGHQYGVTLGGASGQAVGLYMSGTNTWTFTSSRMSSAAGAGYIVNQVGGTAFTGGAGIAQQGMLVDYVVNQTSTASFDLIKASVTNSGVALASGDQNLLHLTVGGTSVFKVKNAQLAADAGRIQAVDGTVSAPAYSFLSAPTTGIYYAPGGAALAIATGGVARALFTSTSWLPSGTIDLGSTTSRFRDGYIDRLLANDGTAASPSISFRNATGQGLYYISSGVAGAAAGGIEVFRYQAPGGIEPQLILADGSAAKPSLTWSGSNTTGFYQIAGQIGVAFGGVARYTLLNVGINTSVTGLNWSIGHLNANSRLTLTGRQDTTASASPSITLGQHGDLPFAGANIAQSLVLAYAFTNQTGTSSFDLIKASVTNIALGSGDQNLLHLTVGGTSVFKIKNSTTAAVQGQLQANDGATSSPAYGFMSDPGTGLYFSGANSFSAVSGSTLVCTFAYNGGNTQLRLPDGSNLSPSLAFISDINTGLYRYGTDAIAFVGNNNENFIVDGQAGIPQVRVIIGSGAGTPSYSFINDSDTGMYQDGANQLGFAASGVKIVGITGSNVSSVVPFRGANGSAASPTFSFTGDTDTGIYSISANTLGFATGATLRAQLTTTEFSPGADATYTLGTASLRWSDVFAVQTTIGDLTMRDPKAGQGDKNAAHWKLIEGQDTIHLYNVRTGKKYALALKEADMSLEDEAILKTERARFGWED